MSALTKITFITMACLVCLTATVSAWADDLTGQVVRLGNKPAESGATGRSLNVWDLQVYRGKVYLGMGSTTDNTGPHPVWAFDHAAMAWDDEPEYTVHQEAIERYRVIDGDLYIPAADPSRGNDDRSKFYRRTPDGVWTHYKSRGLRTAHIRDIAVHDGRIVGVGNSRRPHGGVNKQKQRVAASPGAVYVPLEVVQAHTGGEHVLAEFEAAIETGDVADMGKAGPDRRRWSNWFFSVFSMQDGLYASTRWLRWGPPPWPKERLNSRPPMPPLVRWDGEAGTFKAVDEAARRRVAPLQQRPAGDGDAAHRILYPSKPLVYEGTWVAPLRSYGLRRNLYKSAYNQSADFVIKPVEVDAAERVTLPDADALGEAVLVDDGTLYLLANAKQPDDTSGARRVYVYATNKPSAGPDAWREVLHFTSPNLARSFAYVDGTWYFGLGFATGEDSGEAGMLLAVDAKLSR